jgi:uncharacterized membrane-anchored protein YitT (DUF2179 family)
MNFTLIRSIWNTIIPIALGTAIYAFGLHYFIIPNRLMEGGLTGIALLLNYSLNLPPSLTSLLLNIPLFIIGWRLIGRATMIYTVVGTVLLSFFLWMMELAIELKWIIPFYSEEDYLLAALYAGVTLGSGLGIVFRFGGTTGGVDIIARIINKHTGSSIGQVILIFDVLVLTASLFYISKEKVLYTLVAVFISTRVIDFIQEGAYAAKAFTIISDDAEHIARVVTMELERGVTLFPAKGAYSNQNKQVVYCIVNRQETRKLKTLVRRIDPRAFMVISDVHDVLGEGFRPE